jgi:NADPH:quinone reductase-like Zn-dependent oxidoreductase
MRVLIHPTRKRAPAKSARGGYRYREVKFHFVVGMDGAGVVERTGSNVNGFRPGDRVITWSAADGRTWGSYAEFMRVPVKNLSPMPKSLSFAQAAVVPVASLTAFQALFHTEKGGMIPGQRYSFTVQLEALVASPCNLQKAPVCL